MQVGELRLREVQLTTQGHTAGEAVRGEVMVAPGQPRTAREISPLLYRKRTPSVRSEVRAACGRPPAHHSESLSSPLDPVCGCGLAISVS